MRKGIQIICSIGLYLGSLFLIDSALASGHTGGGAHDHDRGGNPVRMLFKGIDLSDEQKSEVRQIMKSHMEKGKQLRENSKKQGDVIRQDTREQIAGLLDEEQMSQFDQNAARMDRSKMEGMDRAKKGKGKMHGDKKRKKMHKHGKGGPGQKHKRPGGPKPKHRG